MTNLNDAQFVRTTTEVEPAGDGAHMVTVKRFEGDKQTAGRAYLVRKGDEPNPSARGSAYRTGWRVSGVGKKTLHPTRKGAVAAAEDHFKNVYLGGR